MSSVAKVYAKALFELGQEKGQLEAIQKDLKSFNELANSHDALKAILSGSGVNPNVRKAVLLDVLKSLEVNKVISSLLELLVSRGRVAALAEISNELEALVQKSQGVQAGQVRSAVELSPEELGVLSSALAKRVGGSVKLTQTVDPSLLGGMVATVAGKTFDASLRSQLERFKNELI
jgi:F-type H+-transporting ATPase subunit delta